MNSFAAYLDHPVGADPNAGRFALRPFDPEALQKTMRVSKSAFDRLNASSWTALIASLVLAPRQDVLTRALIWGLSTPDLLRWAVLAARLEEVLSRRPQCSQALICAERWLREQKEADRYEAYRLAGVEDYATPAALAGMAAYLCGRSIAPQGAPVQAPSPTLGPACAANVLTIVAAAPDLGERGFELINKIGLDIAYGADGREGARSALATAADGGRATSR